MNRASREYIKPPGYVDWDKPLEWDDATGEMRNCLSTHRVNLVLNGVSEVKLHLPDGAILTVHATYQNSTVGLTKDNKHKATFLVKNFNESSVAMQEIQYIQEKPEEQE